MSEATSTQTPEQDIAPVGASISREDWENMGIALTDSVSAALSDRQDLDSSLDYWNDLYEMNVPPRDWPWPNASNVFVPLIPTQLETLVSRLAAVIFVPRLFLVNGNTVDAAQTQHEVERYYNAELWRHGWVQSFYEDLHLGARDGTSYMEVLWRETKHKGKIAIVEAITDGETGMPAVDESGKPKTKTSFEEAEFTDYDDVDLTPVELRDLVLMPPWQTSVEAATAVARALYLDEAQLNAMTKSEKNPRGLLDAEMVKRALDTVTYGQSELSADRQGTDTYQVGGKVAVGSEQGEMNPAEAKGKPVRMRGAIKVWRIHSRQYDLDGDGSPEETVFWVHESSSTLLGYGPYEYWHGKRPFTKCVLMPRPNREYGYSLPERLRTIQEEMNAQHNHRNDEAELRLSPPRYKKNGAKAEDKDMEWGPTALWSVQNADDYGIIPLPPIPRDSYDSEEMLQAYAYQLTGLSAPMTGAQNSGRRTAREVSTQVQSAGVRLDFMAARVRLFLKETFWQIHQLKLQYTKDESDGSVQVQGRPAKLTIDKAVLAKDYTLDVSGIGGPLDKENRRKELLVLYSMLMQNPLLQGNLERIHAITQMVLEEYDRPDVPNLIGTRDDAVKQQQAQQQAAEQKHKEDLQLAYAHVANKGGNGKPPAAGGAPGGAPAQGGGAPPGAVGLGGLGAPAGI